MVGWEHVDGLDAVGVLLDQDHAANSERFDLVGGDDELATAVFGAHPGFAREWCSAAESDVVGLECVHPHLLGPGEASDGLGGGGIVLAAGEDPFDVADDLLVKAFVYAAQVSELLVASMSDSPAERARWKSPAT